ncbi:MAG: alcohol dehydrogenase catalytic domain-containing protein [Planctomycetota bacterium]
MEAIAARGSQPSFLDAAATPGCPPDHAVVRVRLAGDVPERVAAAARDARADAILGRDLVGVVSEVGDEAPTSIRDRLLKARVACASRVAIGTCDMCRAGVPQHCRDGDTLGAGRLDGTLSGSVAIPWRNLALVPDGMDDAVALLAQPLARAIHAARMIRMQGKVYVTVLGDNLNALLAAQVIAQLNATVRILGWRPEVFGRAEKWGIQHRHADEVGRREDQTVVVDCMGSERSLDLALGLVRPRGTIILASASEASATADLSAVVRNELELLGARDGPVSDALAMLARGDIDTAGLIEARVRAPEAPRVLSRPELLYVAVEF